MCDVVSYPMGRPVVRLGMAVRPGPLAAFIPVLKLADPGVLIKMRRGRLGFKVVRVKTRNASPVPLDRHHSLLFLWFVAANPRFVSRVPVEILAFQGPPGPFLVQDETRSPGSAVLFHLPWPQP